VRKLRWFYRTKCVFIATKFIQGNVLSEVIAREKADIPIVARCGYDITKAIQLLWGAERIVHRDINPKNIMLTDGGSAVLIDLGVARHIELETLTIKYVLHRRHEFATIFRRDTPALV